MRNEGAWAAARPQSHTVMRIYTVEVRGATDTVASLRCKTGLKRIRCRATYDHWSLQLGLHWIAGLSVHCRPADCATSGISHKGVKGVELLMSSECQLSDGAHEFEVLLFINALILMIAISGGACKACQNTHLYAALDYKHILSQQHGRMTVPEGCCSAQHL